MISKVAVLRNNPTSNDTTDNPVNNINSVDIFAVQRQHSGDYNKLNKDDIINYLCLFSKNIILAPNCQQPSNDDALRLVLDSGAFPHISNNHFVFDSFFAWPSTASVQRVLLADGTSKAKI